MALSSVVIPLDKAASSLKGSSAEPLPTVEVRSLLTSEWSLPRPTGVAYSPEQNVLVVSGTNANQTAVLRLSPHEDPLGTALLPTISHPATLAFDGVRARLTAVSGNELISVQAPELANRRPKVHERTVAALSLQNPRGATFDQSTGMWFILDDGARNILQVPMHGLSHGSPERISLANLGVARLQGVAHNPTDGLLYVASPDENLLYALDGSGEVQKQYDLAGIDLQDLRAMVFAPSADPTDDPGAMHLFMADAGSPSTLGKVSEVSLDAVVTAAPTVQTTIVQTIDTSLLDPPSPDPSGITYFPETDRLEVSDAEVEEMSIFKGVNLYQLTRTGLLTDTGVTTAYSNEPTGLGFNPADETLFVSDDNKRLIFMVRPGSDGRFGTADDLLVGSIDVKTFGPPVDAEGVDYDPNSGDVFIVDGVGAEVWGVDPGANRTFGDGDDVVSNFDVGQYGAQDPEGIGHDTARDTLLVLDSSSDSVYEVTKSGGLERIIDVSIVPTRGMAGITLAPGTDNPAVMNLWIAARGVDNNADPNENDGKIHELSILGPTPSPTPVSLDKPVLARKGDVEEIRKTGSVVTGQAGLDLIRARVQSSSHPQLVGLRFRNLAVPPGTSVVSAYVQFQAHEASSHPTNLIIRAEASDNPNPFEAIAFNVSSRPLTAASAAWSPPPWKVVGQTGLNQRTSDLAPLLEEIFNRPGWTSGNAIVLVITGTGRRVAEAYDGAKAPKLHIEYLIP